MRITVSSIPEDGLERELEIPVTIGGNESPDMAGVSLRVVRFEERVLIDGVIKIDASLACGRCLKKLTTPMEIQFRDEYNPAAEFSEEKERELDDGELDLSYYSNDEIDIGDIIKEQVLLSVPMKPLCNDRCKGICPECGIDLNKGLCGCTKKDTDARLEPLKKIKALMESRKE